MLPPKSLDPRLTIELFAKQPQLRTPTGIDVDARGRVWVIESNTHFRPETYDGHPSDRLLILTDTDADGRADDVKTFADGFQFAMSVAVRPVWLDEVRIESVPPSVPAAPSDRDAPCARTVNAPKSSSPSAAASGCSKTPTATTSATAAPSSSPWRRRETTRTTGWRASPLTCLGWMYFGLGENLGAPYKLVSRELAGQVESVELGVERPESDQPVQPKSETSQSLNSQLSALNSPLSGGGEGGNIYRMRPDGTQLTHWATGFWNPHASCFDAFGRLFTVDNDADSRPPCRLLHIIEGGDYGFRFRNGRKGCTPSPVGTAKSPARCRWSPARARPPAASWPTSTTPSRRSTSATCW